MVITLIKTNFNMKEIGRMVNMKEKEVGKIKRLKIHIQETLKMDKKKGMVLWSILITLFMKDFGKMIKNMVCGYFSQLMEIN